MKADFVPLRQIFLERRIRLETLDRILPWSEDTGQKLLVGDLINRMVCQLWYDYGTTSAKSWVGKYLNTLLDSLSVGLSGKLI